MGTTDNTRDAAAEVAAAEENLRVALERLEAARTRLADVSSASAAAPESAAAGTTPAASAPTTETVPAVTPVASAPTQSAAPVLPAQPAPAGEPEWVPYSTQPPTVSAVAEHPASASWPAAPSATGSPVPPPSYQALHPERVGAAPLAEPSPVPPDAAQSTEPVVPPYTPPSYGTAAPTSSPSAPPPHPPAFNNPQNYYPQGYQPPAPATKDHVVAGLLAIFLGWLGVHKFYLGYNTPGFIMLGISVLGGILTLSLATGVIWIIAIIEGITYLTKTQAEFEQTYVIHKKEWF